MTVQIKPVTRACSSWQAWNLISWPAADWFYSRFRFWNFPHRGLFWVNRLFEAARGGGFHRSRPTRMTNQISVLHIRWAFSRYDWRGWEYHCSWVSSDRLNEASACGENEREGNVYYEKELLNKTKQKKNPPQGSSFIETLYVSANVVSP